MGDNVLVFGNTGGGMSFSNKTGLIIKSVKNRDNKPSSMVIMSKSSHRKLHEQKNKRVRG